LAAAHAALDGPDRGRDAANPGQIPPAGWKDVLSRVKRRVVENNLSITAAGVAFYALIATFPGVLALSGLYRLVFDRGEMGEHLAFLQEQLQPEATRLLVALLQGLATSDRSRMGFGIAGGVLVTLWGSSLGIRALMRALNVAYGEEERRSVLERTVLALLLTLGAISVAFCIGLAVVSLPVLTHWFDLRSTSQRLVYHARWPAVAAMFWLSLLVLYRYGPSRAQAQWSWVSWGAMIATAMWLSGSGILAWYVAATPNFQQAYGSVGTIVLVLAWFLLSAFSILLGAEINAELERQTRRDTTIGREKPSGARGANAADTLGDSAT
jgi:membrane protein